ncbi:ABC transporter ATP-binding protein [Lentibacillus saliphilus]|uniref:ABC transporter ATP-binding protein n=1 Tax=Lentibacillus saliphilus TaxID=2737028 RepID=UPI001C30D998
MKKVFSFLKPYKLFIIVAYTLTVLELVAELLLPFFLGKMINDGVVKENIDHIIMWGSIMIGLSIFTFVAGVLNSFFASHTSSHFAYDIREALFKKIQSFSFRLLSLYPTSSLMTRFTNDIRQIQNTVFMGLRIMVKAPLLVIGGVVMAFIVNARLALIFLVTVPLLIAFILWVLKKASRLFNNVQKHVDSVNRVMQENLSGMRLVKAFLRRDHEQNRFIEANTDLALSTRKAFRFVEASMPILLFVMNLSLVFILWYGNKQTLAGTTNVGDVVAIVNYALRVAMAISMFTFIILAFSRMKASSERLSDVLTVEVNPIDEEETQMPAAIKNGAISFKNVSFMYPNTDNYVLDHVTFSVEPKEKLAIIGSTGSGKTSLFQLLPRLYDAETGNILFDDEPIESFTLSGLRRSIGYVPQNPLLFSGSIFDNIAWGKEHATQEDVEQAARDAQIHELIAGLSEGYQTRVGQKGVNLSGGQKQRISIARALIRQPKILMLDDSTSALDLATEARLLEALHTYDCTTLIITQKIATAIKADRILLMDQGQILAHGTHDALLDQSELYRLIVASQFGKEHVYGT